MTRVVVARNSSAKLVSVAINLGSERLASWASADDMAGRTGEGGDNVVLSVFLA